MLVSLFEFIRDLAVLAAAAGIAKWAWDQHTLGPRRRDEEARAAMEADRLRADTRQWAGRLEALGVDISTRLDEVLGRQRDGELRAQAEVRVHKLLHQSSEHYLTFAEIEAALAGQTAAAGPDAEPLAGEALRRVLIGLLSAGVIAQLEGDRYFIASDYEAGGEPDGQTA